MPKEKMVELMCARQRRKFSRGIRYATHGRPLGRTEDILGQSMVLGYPAVVVGNELETKNRILLCHGHKKKDVVESCGRASCTRDQPRLCDLNVRDTSSSIELAGQMKNIFSPYACVPCFAPFRESIVMTATQVFKLAVRSSC